MNKKFKIVLPILIAVCVIALAVWYLRGVNIEVLNPKGLIGQKERNLMIFTVALGLAVIIPVFILTIFISWKYRESNTKAKYTPEWDSHRVAEFTWWGIPIAIIMILSVVTWTSTHQLDPYKPLASTTSPINIQVVSLDWKWLFIYPDQNIATVNFVQFPVNTPVNFSITSDSVMNSFWIPQLGGQIYSMPGMSTQLHLEAFTAGNYSGSSANISGSGFANMKFTAKASSQTDFNDWVQLVKQSANHLNDTEYARLIQPSQNVAPIYYSSSDTGLYDTIVMNYMEPLSNKTGANNTIITGRQ